MPAMLQAILTSNELEIERDSYPENEIFDLDCFGVMIPTMNER